jgi:hypothetical protein
MKSKYLDMPKAVEARVGIKVCWYYYKTEEEAIAASEVAKHNARIDEAAGYDFGYQMPGSILKPGQQKFHPDLYEVCAS